MTFIYRPLSAECLVFMAKMIISRSQTLHKVSSFMSRKTCRLNRIRKGITININLFSTKNIKSAQTSARRIRFKNIYFKFVSTN